MSAAGVAASPKPADRLVYYFGVGGIRMVSAGLDRVTRLHWEEISESGVAVEGFVVDPSAQEVEISPRSGAAVLRIYPSEASAAHSGGGSSLLAKARALMQPQALHVGFSLLSRRAKRDAIELSRQRPPGLIVIDHIYAGQNVPLLWVLFKRRPIIFVSHDNTPELLLDLRKDATSLSRKLISYLDFLKALALERLYLARADEVVFLSDYDQQAYGRHVQKSKALLPLDAEGPKAITGKTGFREAGGVHDIVFVGSPSFMPNAHAIRWICEKLSPALWRASPECRIVLIGKGTEALKGDSPNVFGEGFVDDDRLEDLLQNSLALLAPIEHGSGLKIKILDALAAGVPVIATQRALRGFGAFDTHMVIETADPDAAAAAITRLAGSVEKQISLRRRIVDQVSRYRSERAGQFAAIVKRLLG
ncbi:glycosyltransferase [Hansschlegelia quercus]|uniref:glycosyltransferase n=1 Tax=Hansschlegelia quercus TaxID=2528245 RepID=UPI0013EF3654|nr:glycosyltransferase [Hansschlegelia quercus]